MAPWTAEVAVTPRLARDVIRDQFPEVGARRVSVLATGWDNVAFLVDGRWLFRFPRRAVAVPGLQREIAILPRLAARLPLLIPDPQFIGEPSARYPWPFFGARLLPGRELSDSGLPDSRRGRAAASVGHFLGILHDPDIVAVVDGAGLPVDPMQRASAPVRAGRARAVLDRLAHRGIWPGDSRLSHFLDRAEREAAGTGPFGPGPLPVCHGDLHVRHLLVDRAGAATGVIDWGDLCLADPAVDLSIAYSGFAGQARADLLSAYGRPVGSQREQAARVGAVALAAYLAEYAATRGGPRSYRNAWPGSGAP